MIPEVIVIVLLATAVVTSMKLDPVDQCPKNEKWSDRAHKVCDNNEYRYHCMFTVNCTLVECCIEPQLGSYWDSKIEYGVYFFHHDNETDSPEFYKLQSNHYFSQKLITNSSTYWKYQDVAYCKNYTKYKFVSNRTENQAKCEDNSGSYNVALAFAITGWVLLVICVILIVFYKFRKVVFYKFCKEDSNDSNNEGPSSPEEGNLMN
jgi:heme/copper-type cytochrome/quinol oxidase subunit 2